MLVLPDFASPQECFVVKDKFDDYMKASICVWPSNVKEKSTIRETLHEWIVAIDEFKNKCKKPKTAPPSDELANKQRHLVEVMRLKEYAESARDSESIEKANMATLQKIRKAIAMYEREKKFEQKAVLEERLVEKSQFEKLQLEKQKQTQQEVLLDHELIKTKPKPPISAFSSAELLEKKYLDAIKSSRLRIIVQLNAMRRSAIRRKREKVKEIAEAKAKIAGQFIAEDRKGDSAKCRLDQTVDSRVNYCQEAFPEESQLKSCKDKAGIPSEFCVSCCEHEFGGLHYEGRKACFECCSVYSPEAMKPLPGLGPIPIECVNARSQDLPEPCVRALVREGRGLIISQKQMVLV